jgi:signal peptidase II
VAASVAIDLGSKSLAWRLLGDPAAPDAREYDLIPHALLLRTSANPGIVFGIDPAKDWGLGVGAGYAVVILLTLVTCALIFYLFATTRPSQRWLHLACGLTLAGALGNLYDRLVYQHVRDFIQITLRTGDTPLWPWTFNLADAYLVVGVTALALAYLFGVVGTDEGSRRGRKRAG